MNGHAVVQIDETSSPTRIGSIHVPETHRVAPTVGTVRASSGRVTSRGVRLPPLVEPGQRVIFDQWAGRDGVERYLPDGCLLVAEEHLYAILEPDVAVSTPTWVPDEHEMAHHDRT